MGNCMSYNVTLVRDHCPNEVTFPENVTRFPFKVLKKATNKFSTALRNDGFSYSYIGTLDGSKVIVKVYSTCRETYFASIINIMSRIKHKNVVELIGYCLEDDRKMLVHNFLGDYSLDQFLFSDSKVENAELDWGKRVSICHGIALALDYLHNGASPCVVLRDVKPSNVFIDSTFNPKIVDFEVACFLDEGESDHIVGTVGYLDPENYRTGRSSEKTDVYAFGITVLEIISGRRNLQFLRGHSDTSLADWSWELRDSGRIPEIIDPTLSEVSEDEVMRFVYVALSCVRLSSELRPSMSEVRLMLSDGFDYRNTMLTRPRPSLPQNVNHFSFQSLDIATNSFCNRVRRNEFSSSYKGTLNDGSEVIVKVYDTNKNIDFTSIIKIMSGVSHQNVVELIGFCQEDGHQMLVHDFLGDYSLDQLLFSDSRVVPAELDWARRVFICHGIAHALDYLHNRDGTTRVVLRDVTPRNILIDPSFNPKIVDFEVACLLVEGELDHHSSVVGTPGYLDPEYIMRGRFSEKTDVYSFGITLLEIISGRKNVLFVQDHSGTSLADCVWELRGSSRIREILDPTLSEFSLDEVMRFINVALYCVQSSSELRPSMSDVRLMLSNNHDFSNMVLTGPRPTQQGSSYDEIDEILEHPTP